MPHERDEKSADVQEIFSSIPKRYDLLNRILSGRRDVAWRRATVGAMRFFSTNAFLDVATGTADLAVMAAQTFPQINVTGVDFVPRMIELGHKKVEEAGLSERVKLVEGDALSLQFEDGSFDVAAVAFGIRNILDRTAALREMSRVVVPGGQVMVLELTMPEGGVVRPLYGIYLRHVLPAVGRVVSGDTRAYRYLAETIEAFPLREEFRAIMAGAGLQDISVRDLTLGTARLYVGRRPD